MGSSAAAAVLTALIAPAVVPAATLTVATLADAGAGSLRQAIADAAPGDSIDFGVTGTISLTSGALTIDKDLLIRGPGAANLVISGGGGSRVLQLTAGTIALSGVTIRAGRADAGAGIFNAAILAVSNCTFDSNETSVDAGAAIFNSGVLTVSGSRFSSNNADTTGGGIRNDGSATIATSIFERNDADSGGGIFNSGTLAIVGCTFDSNHAFALGGGLRNNSGAAATVTNTTMSANNAVSGGGIFNGGTLTLSSCTIAGNSASVGGGIENTAAAKVAHTILDNNVPTNCSAAPGTLMSAGFNLESASTCGFGGMGDLANTDPMLGPLAANGGPTPTRALLAGSPAIDGGNPSGCSDAGGAPLLVDQRGAPRLFDGDGNGTAVCDIGAYEFGAVPLPDADGDGAPDAADNCPTTVNADQTDRDGDGVGDACDNCVDVFNPAQTDVNGNGAGDLCDGTATPALTLSRVQLGADTTGRGSGRISISGTLDATPVGGPGAFWGALQSGCVVHVSGAGLGVSEAITFPSCVNPKRCTGPGKATARFTLRPGNLLRVSITAPGRTFAPPLTTTPVTVTLSTNGSDQQGTTPSCTIRGRRSQTAVCR